MVARWRVSSRAWWWWQRFGENAKLATTLLISIVTNRLNVVVSSQAMNEEGSRYWVKPLLILISTPDFFMKVVMIRVSR